MSSPQELPRVQQLPVNLRHDLVVSLILDRGLLVEEAAVHEQVDFLAVHGVGEMSDRLGGAEVEFALDFEDFLA